MPNGDNVFLIPHFGTDGYVLTWRNGGWNWEAAGSGSGDITKDELAGASTVTSINDTDYVPISIPGSPNQIEKMTWANYKVALNAIYATIASLSGYVTTATTVNGKALSSNVTLTQDDVGDGTTYKQYSTTEKSKLSGIEASADVTDITNISSSINGASAATPVDADKFPFVDDTDSTIKTVTGANLKTYIGAGGGFDIHALSAETTIAAGDELPFYDVSASGAKKIIYSDLEKSVINAIYFVGIIIPVADTTDPNSLYTWQTWALVEARFLVGYKSGDSDFGTVGATGGVRYINWYHRHIVSVGAPALAPGSAAPLPTGYTSYVGSTTENTLPPFLVVKYWQRTA